MTFRWAQSEAEAERFERQGYRLICRHPTHPESILMRRDEMEDAPENSELSSILQPVLNSTESAAK